MLRAKSMLIDVKQVIVIEVTKKLLLDDSLNNFCDGWNDGDGSKIRQIG